MLSQVQNMNALPNSDQLTWTVGLNPIQFLWLDVSYLVHQTLGPSSTLSPHNRQSHKEKIVQQYAVYTHYSTVQQSLSLSSLFSILYYLRSKAAIIIIHTQTNQTRNLQNPQTHAQNKKFPRGCAPSSFQCAHVEQKRNLTWQVCVLHTNRTVYFFK